MADAQPQNCAKFKSEQYQITEIVDLDPQALEAGDGRFTLTLRNWEPGDQIWRVGQHRPEKLKVLFQQFQVLLWERRHWPVLTAGNQIVWAYMFGPAAPFARKPDATSWIRLNYAGPLGWPSDKLSGFESKI
jgi:tRNA(Ile)-lysidine synthetase-like protein